MSQLRSLFETFTQSQSQTQSQRLRRAREDDETNDDFEDEQSEDEYDIGVNDYEFDDEGEERDVANEIGPMGGVAKSKKRRLYNHSRAALLAQRFIAAAPHIPDSAYVVPGVPSAAEGDGVLNRVVSLRRGGNSWLKVIESLGMTTHAFLTWRKNNANALAAALPRPTLHLGTYAAAPCTRLAQADSLTQHKAMHIPSHGQPSLPLLFHHSRHSEPETLRQAVRQLLNRSHLCGDDTTTLMALEVLSQVDTMKPADMQIIVDILRRHPAAQPVQHLRAGLASSHSSLSLQQHQQEQEQEQRQEQERLRAQLLRDLANSSLPKPSYTMPSGHHGDVVADRRLLLGLFARQQLADGHYDSVEAMLGGRLRDVAVTQVRCLRGVFL